MALSPGAEVGSYVVDSFVGAGGMASVYRVQHRILGSVHALKVLHTELVRHEHVRGRFLEEGRLQAQLHHPGMVRVTDIVAEPGVAGLVMDFLEGTTLGERLERGPLHVSEAVGVMLQVLSAVGYAHEREVIHRDLKPANLFLVGEPDNAKVKVLDFGIAKVAGRQRTVSSATMGTYAYMSPEQLENPAGVDPRADIFALGAVLYEMVTGRTAFEGDTEFATMQRIVKAEFPPLSARLTNAPPALNEAIERALRKDPGERFPSCDAFADAIASLASSEHRELVAEWEAQGPAPAPSPPPPTWHDEELPPPRPFPEPSEAKRLVEEPAPIPDLPALAGGTASDFESRDTAVRVAGAIQFLSGCVNTFLMWMVACSGLGRITVTLAEWFGVPEWISWFGGLVGGLGCLLLLVGILEMVAGLSAVVRGEKSYRLTRLTAFAEVVSLPAGGVLSFFAGLFNLGLLVFVGPPEPGDPVRGPRDSS